MDPAKLKVVELRAELQQRGLDTKGNKPVLVERLRKALDQEVATGGQSKPSVIEDAQDNSEKGAETVKPPQTPKRSSRSSTMTTPTKVSTRNPPRTCTTPNSAKYTSPSKVHHAETPPDVLPTITECAGQDQVEAKQESVIQSPRKAEEKPDAPKTVHNESQEVKPAKVDIEIDDDEKLIEPEKEAPITKSPIKQSPEKESKKDPESPLKEVENTEVSKVVENQHSPAALQEKEDINEPVSNEEEPMVQDLTDDDKQTEVAIENQEDSKVEDSAEEKKESSKPETPEKALNNSEEDKCEDVAMKEEELEMTEEEERNILNEDEDITTPVETEEALDEEMSEKSDKVETKDVEMTESKEERNPKIGSVEETMESVSNQEEESKETDTQETQEDQNMETPDKVESQDIEMAEIKREEPEKCVDRKRKRSPSPAEEPQMSPAPVIVEDEPEIDDSALTLSWYDSDLNLVIEKDGFFTATPLHNDGFLHMWAGARASYGFLHGKVYYEAKITDECDVNSQGQEHPHALRLGWSALKTSMQLGEESKSYGYESTGKKCTNNEFVDYGTEFNKGDVIGCYLDATSDESIVLSYTVNGKDQGTAFTVPKQELDNKPLFPHILSKSCTFACNFGQENPWCEEILEGYVSIGNVESEYKVPGPRRPAKKEDCEVIMMCGLPGSGKTEWSLKYASAHPDKVYNILGISSMINKMKNMGLPCKESYSGKWNILIENCARSLKTLLDMAPIRRRNYILDETNVYASAQRRKMKTFSGYQRKAVVVVPTEEEFKSRVAKHKPIDDTASTDSTLMEMKANFSVPLTGDWFDSVKWVELSEEDGKKVIEKYNKEGKDAGFGQQQDNKRRRMDKPDNVTKDNRDTRNNRDGRDHRRNNYSERNRNSMWRGGNHMGWRDRPQRGGHPRHGPGYGPPAIPWRGRGAPIPPLRGLDRRGDRRAGDRGRGGRQGGWGQMNYQGSQQGGWGQQGSWSGGQSGGWGQGWSGQQWGNWKGYGQGSYGQTNYNQQGYGNGNWSSWNQQYYNQYWDQPQQTGQTTAAGGQATNTTESVTSASSGDSAATYSYPQEWQEYTEGYSSAQSVGADTQQYQRHE